ncbi:MAG: hypothetical protein Ct9H300mP19_15860 [Dehalococcoidia bacterium]|nr:MAG: hypothetical protein Ct9H300mP19_15860 [Dehalococcoidia bacterium]
MLARVHGTDESVGIASLISGTRSMLALAYDLVALNERHNIYVGMLILND